MMPAVWLALTGCPRPPQVESVPPPVDPDPDPEPGLITGPRYWSEPGGLCLEVPEGFSGSTGGPPLLLELEQTGTGFALEIRAWPVGEPPPGRPGHTVLFEDPAGYRAVPILGRDAGSRTWIGDADGRTVTSWFAPLGDRVVEVSILAPPGRSTEARAALDPLVQALCTTWLSD